MIALSNGGCRKAEQVPSPEGVPGQALLQLTLPNLPQRPPSDQVIRQKVVALFTNHPSPYSRAQAQYLHHLAEQDPVLELDWREGDGSALENQMADLLSAPPAALMVECQRPLSSSVVSSLSSLRDAGVYLIALDPVREQRDLFDTSISCDPLRIGEAVADLLIKALTKRSVELGHPNVSGRIMTLRGSAHDSVSSRIQEGFAAGLKDHPGILIVHDAPADWSLNDAKTRFTEALRLQHPLDAVFAHDDLLAQAIHQIASEKEVRDDLFLVGINGFAGSEGGIEMIRNLELDATCQRPFLVDVAWRLIQRHLAGEPPPIRQHLLLAPRPIVPADLDQPENLHPSVDDL